MNALRLTPIHTIRVNGKRSLDAWAYEDNSGILVLYHSGPGTIIEFTVPKKNVLAYAVRAVKKGA